MDSMRASPLPQDDEDVELELKTWAVPENVRVRMWTPSGDADVRTIMKNIVEHSVESAIKAQDWELYPSTDMRGGFAVNELIANIKSLTQAFLLAASIRQEHLELGVKACIDDRGWGYELEYLRHRRAELEQGWDIVGSWALQFRVMMSHVRIKYLSFASWSNKLLREGGFLTDVKKKNILKAHPPQLRELYKTVSVGIAKDEHRPQYCEDGWSADSSLPFESAVVPPRSSPAVAPAFPSRVTAAFRTYDKEVFHKEDVVASEMPKKKKEDDDDLTHSGLISFYTSLPSKKSFMIGAVTYYCNLAMLCCMLVTAVIGDDLELFALSLVALVVPGLVQGLNVFVMSMLLKPVTITERVFDASLHIFCLVRGVEAWRYHHGKPPEGWSRLCKERLASLTLMSLPAVVGNIRALLLLQDMSLFKTMLVVVSIVNFLWQNPFIVKLCHGMRGDPGNCQVYRFWDLKQRPYLEVSIVFLIDFSQVTYRFLMIALVATLASYKEALGICGIYAGVACRFFELGFGMSPIKHPVSLSLAAAVENVTFDYAWLEPIPLYKFYLQHCYFLRAMQISLAIYIMLSHWDRVEDLNQFSFWIIFASFVVTSVMYFFLYPLYVYCLRWDRAIASDRRSDMFLRSVINLKVEGATNLDKPDGLQGVGGTLWKSLDLKDSPGKEKGLSLQDIEDLLRKTSNLPRQVVYL